MEFAFLPRVPGPRLAPYVEQLFYARGRIEYGGESILPTGRATLLVVLGDPIAQAPGDNGEHVASRSLVSGLQQRALHNRPLGETHVCGVSFAAGGAMALLGLPQCELRDAVVDLADVWGRAAADQLRQRVGEAVGPVAKLEVLESALAARLEPGSDIQRVGMLLDYLSRATPPSMCELASALGVSHKHLISVCKNAVGATPGRVARIYRFNRLLASIGPSGSNRWAELGLGHGYCDQAHMAREFRRLAGMSPTQYVRRREAVFGAAAPSSPLSFVPDAIG